MPDQETDELLQRAGSGDEQAAAELYNRYVDGLIEIARRRLSPKLSRRTDPEDIVQSAFRSFFRHAQSGRYTVRDGTDLWRLLAAITINKALRAVRRHTACKRSVEAERSRGRDIALASVPPEVYSSNPTPAEAAVLVDETEFVMRQLSPLQRRVLEVRLQGCTVEQTAAEVGCSERTVHRVMGLVRTRLEQRLLSDLSSDRVAR